MSQAEQKVEEKKTFQVMYQESCQKAGELQYRIYMHKLELKKLNKYIKKLNIDAHREIQKQQAIQQALLIKKQSENVASNEAEKNDPLDITLDEHKEIA